MLCLKNQGLNQASTKPLFLLSPEVSFICFNKLTQYSQKVTKALNDEILHLVPYHEKGKLLK